MELLGVITGLEALNRPCTVEVHTDSQYVVNAFNQHWIEGWLKRGWKNAKKEPVKNIDLWKRLIAAKEPHSVSFHWVKGHAGHPLNERCDDLATTAADGMGKIIDEVRAQQLRVLQFLGHAVKAFGETFKFTVQIQVDAHLEVAVRQLVDGLNQVADGFEGDAA